MTQANRFALLPRLVLALWLTLSATGTDAEEPLRMTHVLDVNGKRVPVATEIFLQPAGQTRIAVKVAGNLGSCNVICPACCRAWWRTPASAALASR